MFTISNITELHVQPTLQKCSNLLESKSIEHSTSPCAQHVQLFVLLQEKNKLFYASRLKMQEVIDFTTVLRFVDSCRCQVQDH